MMKTRQLGSGDKRGRPRDTPLPSVTGSVGWAGQPAHPKATAEPGVISWLWENINPLVPTDSLQGKIFFSKESKDCKTERDRPGPLLGHSQPRPRGLWVPSALFGLLPFLER